MIRLLLLAVVSLFYLPSSYDILTLYEFLGAPYLCMQSLHILRNLYFISSRTGQTGSSQQNFVFLAAIDILSQYPDLAEKFLRSIKPRDIGQIPDHPVERCLDLFFLNTAEHFPVILTPETSEELLLSAAFPYLAAGANSLLLEIFEAAHSLTLVVFAIPHNAELAAKHLPFYIENLFAVSHLTTSFETLKSNIHPGIPRKSLSKTIPPRFQDSHSSHRPSIPPRKQPTPPPINPPRSRPRPRPNRINHTHPTKHPKRLLARSTTPLRPSRPHPRTNRLPLFPARRRPGRVAPPDRAINQRHS